MFFEIIMKKIQTYTIGWDPEHKTGYFKAEMEDGSSLVREGLNDREMLIILEMLRNPPLYTDKAGWLIGGWVSKAQPINL